MSLLHITTSQMIIRRHLRMSHIGVQHTRDVIKRAALHVHTGEELGPDKRMREELEKATGMPITELAILAERWD